MDEDFLVENDIMEMISVKVKSHNNDSESCAGQKSQVPQGTQEQSASKSFIAEFQKFLGQQAHSIFGSVSNFDAISQVKPQAEVVEKPIEEKQKFEEKTDNDLVEEEQSKDDEQSVVVSEQTEEYKKEEVVLKQSADKPENDKPEEVVEQVPVVVVHAAEQTQNTGEIILADKQVKIENQASKFDLNKQNLEQKTAQNQKTVNENLSVNQQAENVVEQAPKAQVGEVEKVKQQFTKISDEAAKTERPRAEKTTDPIVVKAETTTEIKPQQLVDRNKVSQAIENVALRNPVVQAVISDSLSTHVSSNNTAEVVTKNVQSSASLNVTNEKNSIKKSLGTTASDLPKTQQDKVIEKLQQMIETAAKARNANTMVVRLDPPELGQMVVKVSYRGDQIFARIIPESADVETALRSRAAEIMNVLENSGFKADNIHISFGGAQDPSEMSLFGQMMSNNNSQSKANLHNRSTGVKNALNIADSKQEKLATYEQTGWIA